MPELVSIEVDPALVTPRNPNLLLSATGSVVEADERLAATLAALFTKLVEPHGPV